VRERGQQVVTPLEKADAERFSCLIEFRWKEGLFVSSFRLKKSEECDNEGRFFA